MVRRACIRSNGPLDGPRPYTGLGHFSLQLRTRNTNPSDGDTVPLQKQDGLRHRRMRERMGSATHEDCGRPEPRSSLVGRPAHLPQSERGWSSVVGAPSRASRP